jgi:hypothetical protein
MELLESDGARPRQARYQAALRPDMNCLAILRYFHKSSYHKPEGHCVMPLEAFAC